MRRQAIERLLPAVYQRAAATTGVLPALLEAMEAMHAPSEDVLAAVDDLFTAYRSPAKMVHFLLGWLAFDHVLSRPGPHAPTVSAVPMGRLRDLLADGASLAQRRGTAAGLRDVIATVTGLPVRISEPPDRPFHVVVHVPASAADQIPLIRRVVEAEKPAATTSEVVVEDIASAEAEEEQS
jgi:phage tail-like protein